MKVTVLGSGTSHGVPMIGCSCPVCTSPNAKNRRYRPSIAVVGDGGTILVDTTPELRLQAIDFGLARVDAVFMTHTHADHVFGLDDLRRFNTLQGGEIPLYGSRTTLDDIRRIYDYIFKETQEGGGKPKITLHEMPPTTELFGLSIRSMTVMHGSLAVLAYRFNDFAYVTDTNHIPEDSMAQLQGLDTLILDAVRLKPHSTHFCLSEAVEVIERLKPRSAFLTHLSHKMDHDMVNASLPPYIQLAHDGLRLEF